MQNYELDKVLREGGKTVAETVIFESDDKSSAMTKAEAAAIEKGFDVGILQADDPRGLARNRNISKWRNIPDMHYSKLQGMICRDEDERKTLKMALVIFS